MIKKTKIVVAVDLSDFSEQIVQYGGVLALKLDAELILVNVINQRDLDMVHRTMIGFDSFSFPDYMAGQEEDRESKMRDLVRTVCPDSVDCRFFIRSGVPHSELLEVVGAEKADLLVVGTKGRSNLADAVIGSVARKLYRKSPIPLLAIPAGFEEGKRD